MDNVVNVKDLGSGVIGGVEYDHLAFRTSEVDWEIWIAQGSRPYPCRYVITSTKVAQAPRFCITIRDWKTGDKVGSEDFSFKHTKNAKKMDLADLPNMDELPNGLCGRRDKMTFRSDSVMFLMAEIIVLCGLELGQQFSIPGVHSFISSAEAVVGRPLTPVSLPASPGGRFAAARVGAYDC